MTIRVFVGCDPNGCDIESQAVLEWSIRKHASEPVDIVWMQLSNDPASFWYGWDTTRWATPFSGFRWSIPAYCGFEGKAIYTDSDVMFMADIAGLWGQNFHPGRVVASKPGSWRMCVSLWDCAAAEEHMLPLAQLKEHSGSHAQMGKRFQNPNLVQPFTGNWNCLDGESYASLSDPEIKAIHYTDMSCQPQLRHALPRLHAAGQRHWFEESGGTTREHPRPDVVALFDTLLAEAVEHGFHPENYLPAEPYGPFRKASLANYRGRAS